MSSQNPILDDYMRAVELQVLSVVPKEDAQEFLAETRIHLQQAIRSRVECGADRHQATTEVLKRYGPAKLNADDFSASWFQYKQVTRLTKLIGRANLIAVKQFVIAEVICLGLLEVGMKSLSNTNAQLGFAICLTIVASAVAGWLVGQKVPVRAVRSIYNALVPLTLVSFLIGASLMPNPTGVFFALSQLALVLPLGCLSAHLSSSSIRRRRTIQMIKAAEAASNP